MADSGTRRLTPTDFRPPVLEPRTRSSGILLHPTSLPGGGVGDLGAAAYRFVDFLTAAKQSLWQFMPLGPVGLGNSPYAARSAFAGSPLLINLDQLVERGWLTEAEAAQVPGEPPDRVRYDQASDSKQAAIARAHRRFELDARPAEQAEFEAFCAEQRGWLDDFALFMALKEMHGEGSWLDWDQALIRRQPEALDTARRELAESVRRQQFTQYLFFQQWGKLKAYANAHGIRLVGDIPIFVAHDSADVWTHQDLFFLEQTGQATAVAGVPPDIFSATGQRWGNPLYRWDRLAEQRYAWWIERFRQTLRLVDIVRLDHFRGFHAYWEVPAAYETAERGSWVAGPGAALFEAVEAALGRVPMIVEDLGLITPGVVRLRDRLGYPGMKVLQFAFGDDATNPYLPHNYLRDFVVYTGTHDNDTTVGWFSSLPEPERHAVRRYLGSDGHDIAWDLIRCALASVADSAIVPLQDVLALGSKARMNLPGKPDENWTWRYCDDQLRPEHAERLGDLTHIYGRAPARSAATV